MTKTYWPMVPLGEFLMQSQEREPVLAVRNFPNFGIDRLLQVGEASPGSADRNRPLRSTKMLDIEIRVPPIESQQRFGELLRKSEAFLPSILDRALKGEL